MDTLSQVCGRYTRVEGLDARIHAAPAALRMDKLTFTGLPPFTLGRTIEKTGVSLRDFRKIYLP